MFRPLSPEEVAMKEAAKLIMEALLRKENQVTYHNRRREEREDLELLKLARKLEKGDPEAWKPDAIREVERDAEAFERYASKIETADGDKDTIRQLQDIASRLRYKANELIEGYCKTEEYKEKWA